MAEGVMGFGGGPSMMAGSGANAASSIAPAAILAAAPAPILAASANRAGAALQPGTATVTNLGGGSGLPGADVSRRSVLG